MGQVYLINVINGNAIQCMYTQYICTCTHITIINYLHTYTYYK